MVINKLAPHNSTHPEWLSLRGEVNHTITMGVDCMENERVSAGAECLPQRRP